MKKILQQRKIITGEYVVLDGAKALAYLQNLVRI
jgi:hypothetical protein